MADTANMALAIIIIAIIGLIVYSKIRQQSVIETIQNIKEKIMEVKEKNG